MTIDWRSDPMLADMVRRARNGEPIVDESDLEADRLEARKARDRESSRLSQAKRRARLKTMRNGRMGG